MRKMTDDNLPYKMLLERERENRERKLAQMRAETIREREERDQRLIAFTRARERQRRRQQEVRELLINKERIKSNAEEYDKIIAAQDAMHDIIGGPNGVSSRAKAGPQGASEAVQEGGNSLSKETDGDL